MAKENVRERADSIIRCGKTYLVTNGWLYTGRPPHEWTHPEYSPESRSYADALLIQIVNDGNSSLYVSSQSVISAIEKVDKELGDAGLETLSAERMAIDRVLREMKEVIALSSGLRRPVGTYGTRSRKQP